MKSEQNMHYLTPINALKLIPTFNVRLNSANEQFMQTIFRVVCVMQVNFFVVIIIWLIKGSESIIKLLTFIKKPLNKHRCTPTSRTVNITQHFYTDDERAIEFNKNHYTELLDEGKCAIDTTKTTTTTQSFYWIKLNHIRSQQNHKKLIQCTRFNRYQSSSNITTISNKFYRRHGHQSTLLKLFGFLMLFTSVVALPPVVRIGKFIIMIFIYIRVEITKTLPMREVEGWRVGEVERLPKKIHFTKSFTV